MIKTIPWKESPMTQIWDVTEQMRRVSPVEHPADDSGLGIWLVHAPWMHMLWCWHFAALIHLRDLPGQSQPPTRLFPGATHEFMVFAVDPDCKVDIDDLAPLKFLSPVSILQQFTAPHDADALRRIEDGLGLTLDARLTLDEDGRTRWRMFLT